MRLIELKEKISECNIVKDADFDMLGMITTTYSKEQVLVFLMDEKYLPALLENRNVTSIITTPNNLSLISTLNYGIILADNPKKLFYEIHNHLVDNQKYWNSFDKSIDNSSTISPKSIIADKNVTIGKNCIIEDGVIINEGVIMGDNVIIRSGTILGTTGFQFYNDANEIYQVKTGGRLVIMDNVEVQHNCCIDRGVFGGSTVIHNNVKIDNMVHLAHDCVIGQNTLITAGVKFGGRTIVGKNCWIGINATLSNGLSIGDNVTISLGSVVTRNVKDGSTVSGNFAIDHDKFITFIKSIR